MSSFFGAHGFDLVVGVEDNMISLANGCVCCSIRDDLIEAGDQVLQCPESPKYVILEARGVADPMGIVATFNGSKHRDRIRLDSITCIVDAEQVFANPEHFGLVRLKLLQIAWADLRILNKVDLAGSEQVRTVRKWIDDQINRVRIVEASHCDVPLEILLSAGRFDPVKLDFEQPGDDHHDCDDPGCTHEHHNHSQAFSTWSYESDRPFSLEALQETIKKRLPASVYRCKGIVYVAHAPERRGVLQVVGRYTDVTLMDEWNGRKPRTQIVVIGAPGSIDAEALRRHFDACLSIPDHS